MLPVRSVDLWKQTARRTKAELYAIYLACKDPRVPWYAWLLATCVVAYAFSPIDLIPDFIPILGYVDDLILIPLGIALVLRLIPQDVMAESRAKAAAAIAEGKPTNWLAAGIIVALWLLVALAGVVLVFRAVGVELRAPYVH
ncbi:MAG TPA: YkvA family protein [Chloroflexota bacterium]|nr:YkvA family protein [Chloroflexota bacterium]